MAIYADTIMIMNVTNSSHGLVTDLDIVTKFDGFTDV